MSYILHIETATTVCSVAVSFQNKLISIRETEELNAHSSKITVFIDDCLKEAGIQATQLQAVSLSAGPGSYTGLRIGAATAKGLCYALEKSLISVSTLQSMAAGFLKEVSLQERDFLLCPLIDARRMEVYYAIYDKELNETKVPAAQVVTAEFLKEFNEKKFFLFGTGAEKCRSRNLSPNLIIKDGNFTSARHQVELSYSKFLNKDFEDVAYFEPFYLKEFYSRLGLTAKDAGPE